MRQALQFLSTMTKGKELIHFIRNCIYVDDALKSMNTPEEINSLIENMQELLAKYSMSIKTIFTNKEVNPNLESYQTKILNSCHLVDSRISYIVSCFHLNAKQTCGASRRSTHGIYILQGNRLAREVVRKCPKCRKQMTNTK